MAKIIVGDNTVRFDALEPGSLFRMNGEFLIKLTLGASLSFSGSPWGEQIADYAANLSDGRVVKLVGSLAVETLPDAAIYPVGREAR
jgi:hypothetical protein